MSTPDLAALYRKHKSVPLVAQAIGLSVSWTYKKLMVAGVELRGTKRRGPTLSTDDFSRKHRDIIADLKRGLSSGQIAAVRGVSRQYICQIADRAGIQLRQTSPRRNPRQFPVTAVAGASHG